MTTAAVIAAALVLVWWSWRAVRWWQARARLDPRRDPAARLVGHAQRARLEEAIRVGSVAEAVEATRVGDLYWREGLRRLAPSLAALPHDPDHDALRAEVHLGLAELDSARTRVAALPADHWRACVVRAGIYAAEQDADRADSALVAALQLAPEAERDRVLDRLAALRRRFPRRRSPHLALWERPP